VPTCPQQTYVSGTCDNSVVFPYFDIATKYGFANYFFQTNQGPSMPAHLFLFSGTSAPTGTPPQEGALNFFQAENPPGGVNNDNNNTACTAPPTQRVQLIDQNGVEDHNNSQYMPLC
jgi:phosphoesterase family protein